MDFYAGVDEGRGEHGHADAKVGVHAVLELLRCAANNALALACCVAGAEGVDGVLGVLCVDGFFDFLLRGGLDYAVDVDARDVDGVGLDVANLDDVFCFDDRDFGVAGHRAVEVLRAEAELHVAQAIGLVGLDEGVVTPDSLFHDERLALENLDIARCRVLRNRAVTVVAESELTSLNNSAKGGRRVESGNAGTASTTPLRKRALRCEFELKLTGEVHLLEHLVLANIRCDHLLNLLALEQETETSTNDTSIVRDGGQTSNRRVLLDRVDQGVGYTRETEATTKESAIGLHVLDRFLRGREDLVDLIAAEGGAEVARKVEVCLSASIGVLKSFRGCDYLCAVPREGARSAECEGYRRHRAGSSRGSFNVNCTAEEHNHSVKRISM